MDLLHIVLLTVFVQIRTIPATNDTLNASGSIRDGESLVSSGGTFELGFFSLRNPSRRYLGIWFRNITVRTYVWVANGPTPLGSGGGILRFVGPTGNLALLDGGLNGTIVWSTNSSGSGSSARLLDSGNLVVQAAGLESGPPAWQSFEHPSDTFLPGMSFGVNYVRGIDARYTSWRSADDDPSPGDYTSRLDPTGYPQIFLTGPGGRVVNRVGPWNGARFSGAVGTRNNPSLRMSRDEVVYTEDNEDPSVITLLKVVPFGVVQRWTWDGGSWVVNFNLTNEPCDSYNRCGAHGLCDDGGSCGCLDGFVRRPGLGCVRRSELRCSGDVFERYSGIKLPDARNCTVNGEATLLSDCEAECSRNCSCTAYTVLDIRESVSGCLFYHGDLVDIKAMRQGGQDLYIRLGPGGLGSKGNNNRVKLIATVTSVAGVSLVAVGIVFVCYRKRMKDKNRRNSVAGPFSGTEHGKDAELPFFDLSTISKATGHFSTQNKLGEGGFGPVYKGTMENGQEIAVKCLAKASSQGVEELKNELTLIAKLQHRNLVRLLGFCIERDENMLIYEYMPNGSLDLILFDKTKSSLLDWRMRFNIINGIAKGLLYLHQDSRLRIIHRDLKASNILLDADMNPKISDFGLARGFGGSETEAKTRRVVGTYGYMSPEYAIDGLFSVKSDVFSFGVLVLEIVSGKRNRGFSLKDHNLNLVAHAWTLYKEENLRELVDDTLGNSFDFSQVMRSIHVGLLCLQRRPEDRPSMSSVVFMQGNEVELPPVKEPGFFTERDVTAGEGSSGTNAFASENQVTVTLLEGR
ncbi:G-type lectin S-receptor-like serine/threonine-protein kinase [Striga hermonthica]|uniref:Receptor-like serine/threonine-protein kinase n=1 Tax=Striga hermonthica TaxID=68872 RepID=A0A9N7RP97_STRHE|nr:G-type lectin S-receptor-like serine/threonine-protein kinase [Striga hermonthica]